MSDTESAKAPAQDDADPTMAPTMIMRATPSVQYVAGFLFYQDIVVLIRKNKPTWQRGRLNGIGGKIELFDASPADAMRREFREEAGIDITDWKLFSVMTGADWQVSWFETTVPFEVGSKAHSTTDEIIHHIVVQSIWGRSDIVRNLRVMLALALDNSGIIRPVPLFDGVPQ